VTNAELIKRLSKYPENTEVRLYISHEDAFHNIGKVVNDTVFVYGQPFRYEVLIVSKEVSNESNE
jgi:hypothetical protein